MDHLERSLLQSIEAQPLLMRHVQQPFDHPEPPLSFFQLINISLVLEGPIVMWYFRHGLMNAK